VPGRLSCSERWAEEWNWLPSKDYVPRGGLIATCGEPAKADQWWFIYTDGLYFSPDGGEHLSKVMSESGKP